MKSHLNTLRRSLRQLRNHPVLVASLLLAAALATGFGFLLDQSRADGQARKSAEVLAFEHSPADWLVHERGLAHFRSALDQGRLAAVGLVAAPRGLVLYTLSDGSKASMQVPGCSERSCSGTVLDRLDDRSAASGFALTSIEIDPRPASRRVVDAIDRLLVPLLVLLAVGGLMFAVLRQQGGFGNAAARLAQRPQTRFDDVIGAEEAKAALRRVKAFLHDPTRYARLGAAAPRGVLLVGPPGTGKTLLAKALAGESQASFIAVDGSYFTSMFFGAGVTKVRDLFKLARKHAPCVLFIDEIDGIGRRSGAASASGGGGAPGGGSGGSAESELNRIINRVLVEMDGFQALDNVVVVAATNHEHQIDDALRRPGRFDLLVRLGAPTLPERQRLYEHCIERLRHDGRADSAALARMSAGMTPADIANVVNQAASTAAEAGADSVGAEHLLRAVESQQLGGALRTGQAPLADDTRRRLAIHEAGHALVAHGLRVGAVERVSIEPRGKALGVTYISRESEDPLYAQAELGSRLAMMLGGREAELLALGSVSSGASDDLKRASELAVEMVGALGFSKTFGLLSVAGVPRDLLGPDVQSALLSEARALLEQAQSRALQVLMQHRTRLDSLARALLEREVIGGAELLNLLEGTVVLSGGNPDIDSQLSRLHPSFRPHPARPAVPTATEACLPA
ncbi:MAG: AAA family ATPase [Rubrivivax sp.]